MVDLFLVRLNLIGGALDARAQPLHDLTALSISLSMLSQCTELRIKLFILVLSGWPAWKPFNICFWSVDRITMRSCTVTPRRIWRRRLWFAGPFQKFSLLFS